MIRETTKKDYERRNDIEEQASKHDTPSSNLCASVSLFIPQQDKEYSHLFRTFRVTSLRGTGRKNDIKNKQANRALSLVTSVVAFSY